MSNKLLQELRQELVRPDWLICFLSVIFYLSCGIYFMFQGRTSTLVSCLAMSFLIVLYWGLQVLYFGRSSGAKLFNTFAIIGIDIYFYLEVLRDTP